MWDRSEIGFVGSIGDVAESILVGDVSETAFVDMGNIEIDKS
jgi:hypothetical protein